MTKRLCFSLAFILVAVLARAEPVRFPAASPAAEIDQRVGLTDIQIKYSRPDARGRPVFGGIVPYGVVWRTGANSATTIEFSTDVTLNGTAVPKGTYALFSIPKEGAWTIILNKTSKQWGAFDYKQAADEARFDAETTALADPVETFSIDLSNLTDDSADLNLCWAKTKVAIHLHTDAIAVVRGQIEQALADGKTQTAGFDLNSANFLYDHGQDLDRTLQLVNQFITLAPKMAYEGLYLKAEVLAKQGDKSGAIAAAQAGRAGSIKSEGPKNKWVEMDDALIASLHE